MDISFIFLLCFSFLFFSPLFVRPPQTAILPFLHFFLLGMVLITVLQTSIHRSSGTLSYLIPWIYFSLPLYNRRGFDLGRTWTFFNLSLDLAIRSSWSEPQSAPSLVFADCIVLFCWKLAWGTPPVAKVMRKEPRHTQRWDRASGVPLEILEHLPPNLESAYFTTLCSHLHLWLYGGLSPTTSFGEGVKLRSPVNNNSWAW